MFGVSPSVTDASNIVNMGTMDTTTPFWNFSQRESVDSLFALKSTCKNNDCGEGIKVFIQGDDLTYFTLDEDQLDDVLNQNAINENRTRFWTSEISLVPTVFKVSISEELILQRFVEANKTLGTIRALLSHFTNSRYGVFEGDKRVDQNTVVTRNFTLCVKRLVRVQICAPVNDVFFVRAQETLDKIIPISLEGFVVMNKDTNITLDASSAVSNDINISLCHSVVVSGALRGSWLLEHGSTLGSIANLAPFLSNASFNVTNDNTECTSETVINKNMNVIVTFAQTGKTIVEVTIEGDSGLTAEEIEDAVRGSLGGTVSDVVVVENEDGDFVVSIIVTKETVTEVKNVFEDCATNNNNN